MGNNTWEQCLDPFKRSRGTAKASFTSYQDVFGVASDLGSLPQSQPQDLKLGTKIQCEAFGEFSTTGAPTLQIGGIYGAVPAAAGGTGFAQSGVITTGSGAAAWMWHWNAWGIITTVGTSGVMYIHGILDLGISLTGVPATSPCPTTAAARAVTIDTTVAKLWGLGAAWGTSSASNTITVDGFRVEIMTQGISG
jgi:hypothetical protein